MTDEQNTPKTKHVAALDLSIDDTLVGDCGGHSRIVEEPRHNSLIAGLVTVVTEHGYLLLDDDPEQVFEVLAD